MGTAQESEDPSRMGPRIFAGGCLFLLSVLPNDALLIGTAAKASPASEKCARRDLVVRTRRSLLTDGALAAAAAALIPEQAMAKIDSTNPANNYYFPMAKYRYLPRIFRSWIAVDELAPKALAESNWVGLQEIWRRLDDASSAMPLYANAVEGSRSGKKKKKTGNQKTLIADTKAFVKTVYELGKAVDAKNVKKAEAAVADAKKYLLEYRQIAQIDTEDGGVIQIPTGNAAEAGHGGAPLGYVIPAFRGGGLSNDYNYLPDVEMVRKGQVTQSFREFNE